MMLACRRPERAKEFQGTARPFNSPTGMSYTLNELMVVAAAREIKDGEVVFVGMRLPLIAFVVAKKTHAPQCGWSI